MVPDSGFVFLYVQEAHEAFNEWFKHMNCPPVKPTAPVQAKFTEKVAHEMKEAEYNVRLGVMSTHCDT